MIRSLTRWTIILLASVVAIVPFMWLMSTSLKGAEEIFSFPPTFVPDTLVWENYTGVWNAIPFALYLFNSILVAVLSVGLNVILASLAGFSLARYTFKYKQLLFVVVLATMMVPKEIIMIPLFTTILKLHLSDSLLGVVLPFAVEGMGIFLMRQAFLGIPKEIEEAGIMDGASPLRMWWNVMLPMTKPALATLAIFTFIGSWGDFLWPLIVLKSPEHFTVQVGLSYMLGTFVDNYRYVAAGAVLAVIPVVIVFIFMQRHFERGLFAGSEK
jgi:putative chitobiose transport system permease protein